MSTLNSSSRFARSLLCASLLVTGLLSSSALAVGQQTGRMEGRVRDRDSKTPMPQVKVDISSPSLIGGTQSHLTGDDGTFDFGSLPPGTYSVVVSMDGLKPLKRQVLIQLGTTTPVDVEWSPEVDTLQETVEVIGKNQMNADSTQSGAVLNADDQSKVASGRSYQSVTNQVAGVSTSSGQGNPNIMGGNSLMNRYLIDGLDVTDPVTNGFSANINFDSIESLQILTGGMEAQYNSMGGVINLITTGGSDEFHVDTSVYENNSRFSAKNDYGSGITQGYRAFDTRPTSPTSGLQANLSISGPLVKQHLWYSLGLQYEKREASQPAGPPLNVQSPPRTFTSFLPRTKLTFSPVSQHRITFSAFGDPTSIDYVDHGGGNANLETPYASPRQNQGGYSAVLAWDWFITSSLSTRLQLGYQNSQIDNGPQGKLGTIDPAVEARYSTTSGPYDYNRPSRTNLDDGSFWYNPGLDTTDNRKTINAEAALMDEFQAGGRHSFQTGVQARNATHKFENITLGGKSFLDRGGGPGEAGLCNEATGTGCYVRSDTATYGGTEHGFSLGVYAQDRWKPVSWLTILPGIRFDYGTTTDSAGRLVSQLSGFGPRLGAVWDITHDNKTIFSAFYGRSNEVLSLLAAANASPTALTTNYNWDKANKNWVFGSTNGGPDGIILQPHDLTTPHADQIQLGLRRLILSTMTGGIQYTYKKTSNVWDRTEVNQILDPSGTRVIGYQNGNPSQVFLLSTPDHNYNIYQGIDFTMQGNPVPELNIYGAYTLAFKYGPGADELAQLGPQGGTVQSQDFNARQTQFFNGWAFGDVRHQIKLSGSYTIGGFSFGPNISWQSGEVRVATFTVNDPNIGNVLRSPIGTQPGRAPAGNPNDQNAISEFRTPPVMTVDVRAVYALPKFVGIQTNLIVDIFNVLNLGGVTDVVTNEGLATFGNAASHQAPFRAQLAIRAIY